MRPMYHIGVEWRETTIIGKSNELFVFFQLILMWSISFWDRNFKHKLICLFFSIFISLYRFEYFLRPKMRGKNTIQGFSPLLKSRALSIENIEMTFLIQCTFWLMINKSFSYRTKTVQAPAKSIKILKIFASKITSDSIHH